MASDLEEEMQSKSESSIDIRELLPREGPISYIRYGSSVSDDSPRTIHLKLRKMFTKPKKVLKKLL